VKYSSSKLKISETRVSSSSGFEIAKVDGLGRISGSTIWDSFSSKNSMGSASGVD
jgi:hypothetical protein